MANEYAVNTADLTAVADAIRNKSGTSDTLQFPDGFVSAVDEIESGGECRECLVYESLMDGSFAGDHIDNTLTAIRAHAFDSVKFTNALFLLAETVNDYAFSGTNSAAAIIFEKRVKFNGHQGFANTTATKIVFKQGVSSFGANLFFNVNKLTALVMNGEFSVLSGLGYLQSTPIGKGEGYIYVPSALISTYEEATNWSTFAGYFRAIEDYPGIEEY